MKVKVLAIAGTKETKTGKKILQFLAEGREGIVDSWDTSLEVGKEYEGELKTTEWGTTFYPAKSGGSAGGFKKGGYSAPDPDTMLISYAKDVVVAFINAGVITKSNDALVGLDAFTSKFFSILKTRKEGVKQAETKAEEPEEELDISDIDFNG